MSNLFSGINARFRGGSSKPAGPPKSPTLPALNVQSGAPSPHLQPSGTSTPRTAPLGSPALSQQMEASGTPPVTPEDFLRSYHLPHPLPLWLNQQYAKHIVKGNFMTLSTRPKTVDAGEWIAHQVIEHYRNLWHFVRVVHEKEEDGSTICNAKTCPRMSAGANHSFTWLNSRREPVELPAHEYMTLMQRWISGKVDDLNIFPTDPNAVSFAPNPTSVSNMTTAAGDWIGKRSGFPETFVDVCQMIFRQMFRVYAHLYWAHFTEPFYHLNLEKQLNSCFSHFILVATTLDMLKPQELEPMQGLIDLWAANGTFPPESKAYEYANVRVGEKLMQLSTMS